ncbi:HSP20-like chaperones superfamily protein [Actinidia rufa]|uniref:HSP20-like chaperones superfamily protein n=1 Tax=Actinidia rufa TaxID=165716 RepID=A0A7J0ECM1_9ERIC|nr:HSP20-like chaperones superfamily protein [Actinidia rufa]
MAILSEYEEDQKPTKPSSSGKPFNAALDPSNPLGFLEAVFEFVSRESDLFKSDSVVRDVNALVRAVKEKVDSEEKKRREKAEKRASEERARASASVKEEKKEAEAESEKTTDGKKAPNKGNGLDMDNYSWVQTLQEVTINVPVPPGTKSRFITCEIKKNHLKVGLKGQPPIIDGELFQSVKVDDSFWSLGTSALHKTSTKALHIHRIRKSISVLLTKQNQMEWWKCLVKGGPEIDTQKFDQRQKSMGLPTSDEMQKQEILKKFMSEHPEMDFSRAKMS